MVRDRRDFSTEDCGGNEGRRRTKDNNARS